MYIYIRAMSEYQSEIYRKLTDASDQINVHLIKILLYPDCQYVDHWMHEVWAFLFRIDKLKGKNKWPKSAFIFNAMSVHNDTVEQYIDIVKDIESKLVPRDISPKTVEGALILYQSWIADVLSREGKVNQSDAKNVIRGILTNTL